MKIAIGCDHAGVSMKNELIPVLEELQRGGHPRKEEVLGLVADLPLLSIDPEVEHIVKTYIERGIMPKDPRGDALHLALASFHSSHFLLTWNCAHLANAKLSLRDHAAMGAERAAHFIVVELGVEQGFPHRRLRVSQQAVPPDYRVRPLERKAGSLRAKDAPLR